ncbi:hypothetical protein [Actinokineospora diospyrosa]|uniref:Golgi phosphoprotein 3 GPP34 n=1 Tax=Actinokineospora diospyrosa TaxID=103728 RepID=A0ABT1I5T2_9PSEU|nr:hypothetical protein [Actinokineospora diospyrosa]MCP2267984.1 hypothetical protein [Actinokineospora diospyrosa]
MPKKYGANEQATLIALMLANEEITNTELKARHGVTLDRAGRERLNRDGLLVSHTTSTPFVHQITAAGIAWCEREMAHIEPTPKSGGLARVVFVFARTVIERLLQQHSILGFLHPAAPRPPEMHLVELRPTEPRAAALESADPGLAALEPAALESLIRRVYEELSVKPQDWVRLAKLRPELNGAAKSEVDEVLLAMVRAGDTHLAPDSNRKVLTEADHAAAVRIGGEDNHLMAVDES